MTARSLRPGLIAATAALVLLGGSLTGCNAIDGNPGTWGPSQPYAHEPMNETSVAVPVASEGETGSVARSLEKAGFFCAQVRANDNARQIWCRLTTAGSVNSGESAVTRVDLVSTLDGHLQYAYIGLPDEADNTWETDRAANLMAVLDASILTLWPDDAGPVRGAANKVANPDTGVGKDRSDPRPPARASITTENATYAIGEGRYFGEGITVSGSPTLTLTLTTKAATDRSWPYGGEHYAATTTAAAPGLEAGGFDCYGPQQSPCTRPAGNQQINYTTRGRTDQILTASVGMGGGILQPAQGPSSIAEWGFPQGLSFLTDRVRRAVEQQLNHSRLTGESFIGILEGTTVVLEARRTPPQQDGTYAVRVDLTVGAPLVTVPGT
jgi:hypothetical protein